MGRRIALIISAGFDPSETFASQIRCDAQRGISTLVW